MHAAPPCSGSGLSHSRYCVPGDSPQAGVQELHDGLQPPSMGQRSSLQLSIEGPSQLLPPCSGNGLLHSRSRDGYLPAVPSQQGEEHSPQSVHPPSIAHGVVAGQSIITGEVGHFFPDPNGGVSTLYVNSLNSRS